MGRFQRCERTAENQLFKTDDARRGESRHKLIDFPSLIYTEHKAGGGAGEEDFERIVMFVQKGGCCLTSRGSP